MTDLQNNVAQPLLYSRGSVSVAVSVGAFRAARASKRFFNFY
jgi:hypothetical protein